MNETGPKSGEPAWLVAMPPDEFNVFFFKKVSHHGYFSEGE